MNEKEMFDNLLKKDPSPGIKNRIIINENREIIIPGWMIDSIEDYVNIGKKSTFHYANKFGYTSQIMYDIGVLGLTSINDRPRCPICGNPVEFNIFTRGYFKTCKNPECSKNAIKLTVTELWKNQEYKEIQSRSHAEWASFPENKELMRVRSLKMWEDDEYRNRLKTAHIEWAKNNPDKVKSGSNFRGIHGKELSQKSRNGYLFYDSTWEKDFIDFCNKSDFIRSIERSKLHIPYLYEDFTRNYFPDFEIELFTGELLLIEIKPKYLINTDSKTKKKIEAGKKFVSEENRFLAYLVLNEEILYDDVHFKKFSSLKLEKFILKSIIV